MSSLQRGPGRAAARPALSGTGPVGMSAGRIADLVARGELSAESVLTAHLEHIAAVDRDVHALVHVDADAAQHRAAEIDARCRAGVPVGPLAGVPFVVKDNIDVRGQTTSTGSHAHDGVVALHDAPVVAALLAADAILLGRANMDELAMGASTQTSAFGPTHNPWDLRRSPGGSSGGSAAAVAAGLAVLSVGTDTGGSIREPAAQCGVLGLAPSPGLVPVEGTVPFASDLDRVGPLARSVPDLAAMLAVLAGRPDLAAVSPVARPLRVGLVRELNGVRNQPGVRDRVHATVRRLADLGVEVVTVSVPDGPAALGAYMTITSAACVESLDRYVRTGQAGEEVVRRWRIGQDLLRDGADRLADAEAVRQRLAEQTRNALGRCDVLLSPTMPTTAPILFDDARAAEQAHSMADPMAAPYTDCWTVVANLAGLPSLSLPAGCSNEDGMPVGVMLTGRSHAEADLLSLAGALEAAQPAA